MKKALKVTFGTMLAVSMVAPAMAFTHDPASLLAVWVEGTYTKPSNNGLSVGDLAFAIPPGGGFDGGRRHTFLNPKNRFDYGLGLTYHWPHTHSHLFLSYDHYDDDHISKGDVDITNIGLAPAAGGGTAGVASVAENSQEFRVGAIHDLHFGDHFCLDILAFLEYDKVRVNLNETNSQTIAGATTINQRETHNKVRGFGPGVGFMSRWYAHSPHWHVFAGANTIILAADNHYNQSWASSATVNDFYIYSPERSQSLVGKLDVNFGINYRCAFRHDLRGAAFDISLGMRYMNMFNALKNGNTYTNPNALVAGGLQGVPSEFAANLGGATDWGRWGPFLKFKLGGAHS